MKNTMKIKSLLSFFVPAAMMSLMVASCSDYDNGYSEQAIKFAQDFRKTFGDIDPEQDWNLAERGTVTVSTMKESEVKIYALTGDEYTIVGDYQGVKGTQMLGFDMVEGTKSILVTDGVTAEKTVPGGVVTFGNTRFIVHEDSKEGVTVSRFTNETEINGKTYLAQKTPTEAEIRTVLEKVPEYAPNLNNVTSNFHYVSTGSFVLYPYYWNTSSINTLGVYYTDANNQYHEVDIYTLNGEESGYVEDYNVYGTDNQVVTYWGSTWTDTDKDGNLYRRPNDWYIEDVDDSKFNTLKKNGWTDDDPVLQKPFIEYWVNGGTGIGTKTIRKNVYRTFTPGKKYLVEVKARLINSGGAVTNDNKGTITFSANDKKVILTDDASSTIKNGVLYSDMDGLEKIWVVCTADSEGKITLKFELNNVQCNWFAFNGMKIYDVSEMTKTGDNFYTSPERGKGIRVDIPEGTTFGMYLKKTETGENGNTHSYTFYSESEKNDYNKVGSGVTVAVNADGNGKTKIKQPGTNPCYASTFKMPVTQDGDDEMFLGFEDWPNIYDNSDFDLNDVVFAFDGCKPTIINEEPDKWLLACEDLGGSFDIDYNDVVFSVEHISGQPTAKLTPLAAGGTLASYIYFQDPLGNRDKCFGEIHQLFGAERVNSGQYDIINARHRFEKTAPTIEFEVDESWTMAYYSTGETGGSRYGDVNMGGFEIRTLESGNDAPATLDITSEAFSGASKIQPSVRNTADNVPYILCLPYSYKHYNYDRTTPAPGKKTLCVWAWPTELTAICNDAGTAGPYPDFAGWVQNHNNNTDWYKNKDYQYADAATVDNLFLSVSSMNQAEINANSGNGGNENGNNNNNNVNYNNNGIYRVNGDEVCRFTFQSGGSTYALAYDAGNLVMKVLDYSDSNQIWRIEKVTTTNNSAYGWLYNYGANKYIDINRTSEQYKAGWIDVSTTPGAESGRFKFIVQDGGYYIYLRYYEKNDPNKYLGFDNIGDGAMVWMDKKVEENKAILWNKTSASEPTSTGGNGDWTTLTSLGNANNNGSGSYSIATLLDICGNASSIELTVEGDSWGSITLIAMNGDAIAWNDASHTLSSSTTTITISKNTLQSWQNEHYDKVLMQNPSSSTKARPI